MNLIQIQEQLKDLPNDPRTMQALTAYANGMNPAVPPYLALGELNRRKQLKEKAQQEAVAEQAQENQGTVKDQIEQSTGIMALQAQQQAQQQQAQQQQAMQQQAMQQQAMQQQAMQQQMAAQRMQRMPPQMPMQQRMPAPMARPVQAARGGLLGRLMSYPAARYRSGGIISFQEAGSVDKRIREMSDAQNAAYKGVEEPAQTRTTEPAQTELTTRDMLMRAMAERARRSAQRPEFVDPLAERERIIKERPELAAALKDTSAEALQRLDEMQALRRAEIEKQREEQRRLRPSVLQQLGQAALASRGQYGRSALASILGGYGELAGKADAESVKQEQALRGRELELQQARMQVLDKINEERRARAKGDLDLVTKAKADHERILRDYNTSDNQLFGRELSAIGQLASTEERERGMLEREGLRQEALTDRAQLLKGREALAQKIAALRAEGKNAEADQLAEAYRSMGGASTALVGEYNAARNLILAQIKVQQNIIDSKGSNRATPQQKEKAKIEKERLEGVLAQLPIPGLPASSAPTPAAAPAASPSAPLGTAANPIKLQ